MSDQQPQPPQDTTPASPNLERMPERPSPPTPGPEKSPDVDTDAADRVAAPSREIAQPAEAQADAGAELPKPPPATPASSLPAPVHPVTPVAAPVAAPVEDAQPQPSAAEETEALRMTAEAARAQAARAQEARTQAARAQADAAVLADSRTPTRRAFLLAAGGAAAGYGFYRYLDDAPSDGMLPLPLRAALRLNEGVSRAVFHDHALAPTYPLRRAETLRVNGVYGLKLALKPESWRLQVVGARDAIHHSRFSKDVTAWEYQYIDQPHQDQGHDTKVDPKLDSARKMAPAAAMGQAEQDEHHTGRRPRGFGEAGESTSTLAPGTAGLLLTMDDLLKLPRRELVTQFKCIEGWSQVVHWAGIPMSDFLEAYPPERIDGREPRYVYMETPDGDYYTGYDLNVLRHPQTLLVTEMMGAPLTQTHGAPLRLHMPTKYGYKQIKRIGLIAYGDAKPDDYWTKLGYDWYAGL